MMRRTKVINYLSNKVLLKEIHKSKLSYCQFDDKKFQDYDIIIDSLDAVTEEVIEAGKAKRANRLNEITADGLFAGGLTNKQIGEQIKKTGLTSKDINEEDIVFRLMANDHVPDVKNKKGETVKAKVNFPAFQHHVLVNGQFKCVGRSHYKDGVFSKDHGQISNALAVSMVKLIDKYGSRGNWRGYSWIDEMKGYATVKLCQVALQFNEAKSENPFAWYTTVIKMAFTHTLNGEKEFLNFKKKLHTGDTLEENFNEQAEREIENYYKDQGMDVPFKKIIMNKPLNFYKKSTNTPKKVVEIQLDIDDTEV